MRSTAVFLAWDGRCQDSDGNCGQHPDVALGTERNHERKHQQGSLKHPETPAPCQRRSRRDRQKEHAEIGQLAEWKCLQLSDLVQSARLPGQVVHNAVNVPAVGIDTRRQRASGKRGKGPGQRAGASLPRCLDTQPTASDRRASQHCEPVDELDVGVAPKGKDHRQPRQFTQRAPSSAHASECPAPTQKTGC